MFYNFYSSKEELVFQLIQRYQGQLNLRFKQLAGNHGYVNKRQFQTLYYEAMMTDQENVLRYLTREDIHNITLRLPAELRVKISKIQQQISENISYLQNPKKNINYNAIINWTQLINLALENKELLISEELPKTIKEIIQQITRLSFKICGWLPKFYEHFLRSAEILSFESNQNLYLTYLNYKIPESLKEVKTVTCFLYGSKEKMMIKNDARSASALLANHIVKELPGYDHCQFCINHPDEYVTLVKELIKNNKIK